MIQSPLFLDWPDADATAKDAIALGGMLRAGDTVLLDGPVGAGKTHFARALIQSLLTVPEDVPSPTFTLVQTYDTRAGTIWHADLYRVVADTEIDELGLEEAFDDCICLIEWPDRLGPLRPQHALDIEITPESDVRKATLRWTDDKWHSRIDGVLHHA